MERRQGLQPNKPLLNRRVVRTFKDELKSSTLEEIDDLFQDLNFEFSEEAETIENVSSVRRKRAAGYIATLDLSKPSDAKRLIAVMERRIRELQRYPEAAPNDMDWFLGELSDEGITWQHNRLDVPGLSVLPSIPFRDALVQQGAGHITDEVDRVLASIDTDPADAITAARSLVESTCKAILEELGAKFQDKDDLPVLYRKTALALGINPTQHEAGIHKQILQGLVSTVQGLAEVRNVLGDAHGKTRAAVRPQPRHARVVAGAAWTISMFLVETLAERQAHASSPQNP